MRALYRTNYDNGKPYRPTVAQRRVLDRFKIAGDVRQLPAHPDLWGRWDALPLQALIRRGYVRMLIGPHENHYLRTRKKLG